jgi:hypothetical protein
VLFDGFGSLFFGAEETNPGGSYRAIRNVRQ